MSRGLGHLFSWKVAGTLAAYWLLPAALIFFSSMFPDRFARDHPVRNTPCLWHPQSPRQGYVVLRFRKTFELDSDAPNPTFWVSADERFILYLDGRLIARGPARSDPVRWLCSRVKPGARKTLRPGTHRLILRNTSAAT